MEPTAYALARTYSDRVYPDPWEKVLDHRRVVEYAGDHPTDGRVRVGNALDLPHERIRGWLNGALPDPVRGINTATDYGWIDPDPAGETAAALVELLAHVLAGGSIGQRTFAVAVTPGRRVGIDEIHTAFERVGVETATRNDDASGRATEVIPTADGTVLGRCLVTMGAARGEKIGLDRLPPVVWDVPPPVRESFARIYVRHRAIDQEGKATLSIQERRPNSYLDDLRRLLTDSTGETVTVGDRGVTISADAARELGVVGRA